MSSQSQKGTCIIAAGYVLPGVTNAEQCKREAARNDFPSVGSWDPKSNRCIAAGVQTQGSMNRDACMRVGGGNSDLNVPGVAHMVKFLPN